MWKPSDILHRFSLILKKKTDFRFRGRRWGISILDRYIFFEIFWIFLVSILLVTSLLMSVVLKEVAGELLGKQIEIHRVAAYVGYLLIEKLNMTIPLASLFSGILAAGRLSSDSEITAMRSAGISFPRIYSVFIFFGFLAMLLVTFINLYYGPISSRAREDFESWLTSYHTLTLVKPGRFLGGADMNGISKTGQDIYAERRDNNLLKKVQIREWYNDLDEERSETVLINNIRIPIGDGFVTQILHAESGELLNRTNPEGEEQKMIRLSDGFLIERDIETREYQFTNFHGGYLDYVIPPPTKAMGRLNVRPENYTFDELFEFLDKLENGGHTINLCEINPECVAGEGSSGGTKLGETGENVSDDMIYTLPAYDEMAMSVQQMRFWVLQNGSKVGQPDGPDPEEFQTRVRLMLQFMIFMKDADKTRLRFEVEIHKRLATPVASILFFFVSFPLGLVVKRSGKGMGFVLALVVFLVYYGFLTVGLSQAYSGSISPAAGAWLPDVVIGIMGVIIMSRRTDGFSPTGFLTYPMRVLWRRLGPPVRRWTDPVVSQVGSVLQRGFGFLNGSLPVSLARKWVYSALEFVMQLRVVRWVLQRLSRIIQRIKN